MATKIKSFEQLLEGIAQNLKNLRMSKGLTQEDMRNHGFNYRHYQKLESGKVAPSLGTLYKLAKAFKVDIRELI